MTVFLGTLFSFIKEIKVPYVFYGEHDTALQAMQGNRALSLGKGRAHVFPRVGTEPGIHCQVMTGIANQNSCLLRDDLTPL